MRGGGWEERIGELVERIEAEIAAAAAESDTQATLAVAREAAGAFAALRERVFRPVADPLREGLRWDDPRKESGAENTAVWTARLLDALDRHDGLMARRAADAERRRARGQAATGTLGMEAMVSSTPFPAV